MERCTLHKYLFLFDAYSYIILCTPCVRPCMLAQSITTVPVHMTLLSIIWKTPKTFMNTSTALFKQHYITAAIRMAAEAYDSGSHLHCGKAIDLLYLEHTVLFSSTAHSKTNTSLSEQTCEGRHQEGQTAFYCPYSLLYCHFVWHHCGVFPDSLQPFHTWKYYTLADHSTVNIQSDVPIWHLISFVRVSGVWLHIWSSHVTFSPSALVCHFNIVLTQNLLWFFFLSAW